jgi:mono/diheme cytochrome c family protein
MHKKDPIMNSRKFELFVGILGTVLMASGILIYSANEPARLITAQASQLRTDLDEAMTLYAENCSVCHGLAGEGIGSNPALDNPGLAGTDSGTLNKIISRGLYGTSMPAWNETDGGPLSDYQIGTLGQLIQFGNWQETGDRVVNLGLAPMIPFATDPDPEVLAGLSDLPEGDILILGINVYAQKCVACHGADGLGTNLAPGLNDQAVREKPLDELDRTVRYGVPGTLMAGWENAITLEELNAVLALISRWDEVEEGAIPEPEAPVPVTVESLELGADVKGYLEETNDAVLQQIIALGVPETAMPAWGDKMMEAEIQAIVGFIRSWEPTAPEVAEPVRGGGSPWWQTEDTSGTARGQGRQGKGGGPTNIETTSQDLQEDPKIEPTAEEPEGAPVVESTDPEQEGVPAVLPDQGHDGNSGGPPEWAGSGNQADQNGHTGEEIPAWSRNENSQNWWEILDGRAWGLLLGVAFLGVFSVIGAILGLSRLPKPGE